MAPRRRVADASVAVRTGAIVRWGGPLSPQAACRRHPEGCVARSPTVPRPALRAVPRRRSRRRRRAAVRRDRRADQGFAGSAPSANVVRLGLPVEELGDGPDDRYRRAARTLATWRSDGTLRKDPHPSIYIYEQRYRVPGTDVERLQRGFFARLRLESYGPEAGVLPHERTLSGPKEDRQAVTRDRREHQSGDRPLRRPVRCRGRRLAAVAAGQPDIDLTDDDGVRHRMWALPASGDGPASVVAGQLLASAGAGPVTIADGHHRYETALRYRDERRMTLVRGGGPPVRLRHALMLEATAQGRRSCRPIVWCDIRSEGATDHSPARASYSR